MDELISVLTVGFLLVGCPVIAAIAFVSGNPIAAVVFGGLFLVTLGVAAAL